MFGDRMPRFICRTLIIPDQAFTFTVWTVGEHSSLPAHTGINISGATDAAAPGPEAVRGPCRKAIFCRFTIVGR